MNNLEKTKSVLSKKEARLDLMELEEILKAQPDAVIGDSEYLPLKHSFSDGIYVRQISIPKGTILIGKIHKDSHPVFLMQGSIKVVTENGCEIFEAPCNFISEPGEKRAAIALTDVVWTTVHTNPTNTEDLDELEKHIISDSYEDYDNYIITKTQNKIA